MKNTKIRWTDHSWNPMTGCTKVSPGCDHCYAETIALRFTKGFPNGFDPMVRPNAWKFPAKTIKPGRIFVNSMSDLMHEAFDDQVLDEVFSIMLANPRHDFIVLTKRVQRLAQYIPSWLERVGLDEVPPQIWLGASIENDSYTFRADYLRELPVLVRFLSCEPLLTPLPSLDLSGIQWVIVGGESGSNHREMNHAWAREIRDYCTAEKLAFYFKQSSAYRSEQGIELDQMVWEQFPLPHPAEHEGDRKVGIY